MTGFGAFLWKEFVEIRRTWRIWVIPGMLVFFGVTSPIIAALTPALVRSMAASQPGVVIQIPPPTALDAYGQFLKNLNQFVLIAVIIAGAGVVSGERSSGTAVLALTKPLSRGAFVLAKILSQIDAPHCGHRAGRSRLPGSDGRGVRRRAPRSRRDGNGVVAALRLIAGRRDDLLFRGVPIARRGRRGGPRVLFLRAPPLGLGSGGAIQFSRFDVGYAGRADGRSRVVRLAGDDGRSRDRDRSGGGAGDLRAAGVVGAG